MPPSEGDGGRWRTGAFVVAIAACLVVVFLGAPPARPASPPVTTAENAFIAQVNAMRTERGLMPLTVDDELTSIARDWATTMADGHGLAHNPNLKEQVKASWTRLSENVGYGQDVEGIMDDFRSSEIHINNMTDPQMTRIGVGVVQDSEGSLWTAHDFMAVESAPATTQAASAPPPRATEPKPKPKPKPRVMTTTKARARQAPTTVTTVASVQIAPPVTTAPRPTRSSATSYLPDEVALSASTTPAIEPSKRPTVPTMILFAVASVLLSTAIVCVRQAAEQGRFRRAI